VLKIMVDFYTLLIGAEGTRLLERPSLGRNI